MKKFENFKIFLLNLSEFLGLTFASILDQYLMNGFYNKILIIFKKARKAKGFFMLNKTNN